MSRLIIFIFILIAAPCSYTMHNKDKLDQVLEKLDFKTDETKRNAYFQKKFGLQNPYGPLTIPTAILNKRIAHLPAPKDACLGRIAIWNLDPADQEMTQKIIQQINELDLAIRAIESYATSNNPIEKILACQTTNLTEQAQNYAYWSIKKAFVDIKLKPWAADFFKTLTKEQRDYIADAACRYIGRLEGFQPQTSLK